ncbi:exonuclease RecJ [Sphaerotilus hippei]|uniref:Single-stranded-DNA-specific exonuclease RecJ n=1 Tax=Sphaerotilus hippei TaxID=744406 RepID=A0A318GXR8_9BURK|nr:single-stranded-DNA-specific exonuclease RecJ [Sphaerotilus hippei]PXW94689.1 exonuclease RecJ [Sphaerotilus hippei]
MTPQIDIRDVPPRASWALEQAGVHPLLARLFAARGIRSQDELDDGLARLIPPAELLGTAAAARLLADTLDAGGHIVMVADYDCDGATACAVALRGLAMLGARPGTLHYVVPDRAVHGYGLTPTIVDLAMEHRPALLVTVDNGIASHAGIERAHELGLRVLVTDHHLPAMDDAGQPTLPAADVIVNPNQPGCSFASKAIAGVGVMFYVLLALRAELRQRDRFDAAGQPRLDALLDLVALGTVADVVKLDTNNRRLVAQGLRRIRAGRMQPGIAALFAAAGRDPQRASAMDFGFSLGPRLNAAGRLADMTIGITCLLTDDGTQAAELARLLDSINRERREVEAGMREQAELLLDALMPEGEVPPAVVLFDPEFHEGVVGIVAGRLKDRLHRPTFVFAIGADGLLKGSGRSIPGFHLRDALDLISKRQPGILKRFGGHSMAAGCTIEQADFDDFDHALQTIAEEWLEPAALQRRLATDGPLEARWFDAATVALLDEQVWGQAFEAPLFVDEVDVLRQRLVGERHLKLSVRLHDQVRDAIWFGRSEPVADRVRLAYRLSLDTWQGQARVQMVVEAAG